MAARGRGSAYTVTVLLLAALACLDQAYSVVHTVGGSKGWELGVDYTSWAAGETFKVGDVLFFPYLQAEHNVVVVDKAGYDACSGANAIATYSAGNDNVTLNSTGTHYYLCSVIGHCSGGMQLAVTVSAAAAAAPATPPTGSTAPAPTKTPPSSAPSPVLSSTPVLAPTVEPPTPNPTPTPTPTPTPASAPASTSAPIPASAPAPGSTPTSAAGTSPPSPPPPNAAQSLLASAVALTPVALLASLLAL